jgi:hypothetical protein
MLETPYSDRLAALKQKLQKHPNRQGLQNRVQTLQGKQQGFKQAQPAPVPYNGQYDSSLASLNQNLQSTQTDLQGQGLSLEQQYGFGSDTSNPYSVARQLERKGQQERTGIGNSMAAQGQLYAGATSNAYNDQAWNHGQEQDSALRDYLAKKASLASQGTQAQNTYEQGSQEAYAQRLQDALNQPVDPTEAARRRKQQPQKNNNNNQNRNRGRR